MAHQALTFAEASSLLNLTLDQIRDLVVSQRLGLIEVNGHICLRTDSVQRFAAEPEIDRARYLQRLRHETQVRHQRSQARRHTDAFAVAP